MRIRACGVEDTVWEANLAERVNAFWNRGLVWIACM